MGWHRRNWMSVEGGRRRIPNLSQNLNICLFSNLVPPLKGTFSNLPFAISTFHPSKVKSLKSLNEKMNKSLIRTSLSSSEGGFDVRSQCASCWGREQKHGNVIGIFQIVQKFSKKAKYNWNRLWHTNISRDSFFEDVSLIWI